MIDLATLTGAIIVALGHEHAGLFSNNDELAEQLTRPAARSGEKLWRMPMNDAYDKPINSDAADVKNIAGSRDAGSIIGAQFLQRFVNNVPWAHLDIAGVTWAKKDTARCPRAAPPSASGCSTAMSPMCSRVDGYRKPEQKDCAGAMLPRKSLL